MHLLDEKYAVSLVTIDGQTRLLATGRLNEDGQNRDTLAYDVTREVGNDNDTVTAFNSAFEEAEARPGNVVRTEAYCQRGTIIVERRLAA